MNKLGKFIKKIREEKDLSLRDLASLCDLSHSYIDSIEKGKDPRSGKPVSPTVDTLGKIAKGLGVSIFELLKYIEPDAYTQAMNQYNLDHININIQKKTDKEPDIDHVYRAETLGDALLRIAEMDYEYDFDDETFSKLVLKAREKYGSLSGGGPEAACRISNYLGPGIIEAGNLEDNCVHEDKLEYNGDEKPMQQKPNFEEHVLSAKTLADASIRIADLFNDYQIDEEEYLRLNTLAYKKFGLPPAPGAEQAAHTKHNIPGTGVFEKDNNGR